MAYIEERNVHQSGLVSVRDVRCRCPAGRHAPTECSSATQAIIPRRGYFQCETPGGLRSADPNQALFFRRGDEFRMHHPAAGGDDCLALAVDDETWERAMGSRPPRGQAATLSPETQLAGLGLLSALTAGRLAGLERDAASLHLLGLLARDAGSAADSRQRQSRARARRTVARATAYLAGHLDRAATLAEVSAAVHCSPYHLTTLFRRFTGLPLHRYHLRWRLLLALERIGRGERRLLDVALEFGFSSASHFSNAVRDTFGTAPSRLAARLATTRAREPRKITQA